MAKNKRQQRIIREKAERNWRKVKERRSAAILVSMPSGLKPFYAGSQPSRVIREFLGKTEGFKDVQEQRWEQKHLKAYLKGYERFTFGYEGQGLDRHPVWHRVDQKLLIESAI